MTFIPDLSRCSYFDGHLSSRASARLRAVGWLEPWAPIPQGPVAADVRARLAELASDPWTPYRFLGFHTCGFCRVRARDGDGEMQGAELPYDQRNLFIPAGRTVFVAPRLITHYIDAHGYQPPPEFCEAVRACPRMRSLGYLFGLARCLRLDFLGMMNRR